MLNAIDWWFTPGDEPMEETISAALERARMGGAEYVRFIDNVVYNKDIFGRIEPCVVAMARVKS